MRWARDGAGVGRLRVTPQLIRVTDDSHLWAATYDATLGEVFRLQSEIAEQVTTALDVALRAPERVGAGGRGYPQPGGVRFLSPGQRLRRAGHRALRRARARSTSTSSAVALDSSFAPAFAKLARAEAAMYWFYYDHSPGPAGAAKRAADAARRLAPDLAEARVALGYYYYWGHLDYERALQEFEAARRQQPSNSELLGAIGYVERRRGRWDAAVDRFREAIDSIPGLAAAHFRPRRHLHVDAPQISRGRAAVRPHDPARPRLGRAVRLQGDAPPGLARRPASARGR